MVVTIKLFEYYEKQIFYSVKNYLLKIVEDVAVGILQSRNFRKYSMLSYF